MANKKISELTQTTSLTGEELIPIVSNGENKAVKVKYLTEVPTKVSELENDKGYLTSIPSEYVTETELENKDYATETFVINKIAEAQLDGGEVNLDGLATKDDLNTKVDKVEGKGLSTNDYTTQEKNKLSGIENNANNYVHPEKHNVSMIEGLANVAKSGNYNDLTNKPTIPSIQGLATEQYVDNAIANASIGGEGGESVDLTAYATKEYVDDRLLEYTTKAYVDELVTNLEQSIVEGKTMIANAITDKGVYTDGNDSFYTMARNIAQIENTAYDNDAYREGRLLVWEEDFNGVELDTTTTWNYETGYIRNEELQNYTDSIKNVYIDNGNLVLKAIREESIGYKKGSGMQTFNWSSGSIHTNNKREFLYGRIEAKIKMDLVKGAFPAFWCLPHDYEYVCSEDDNRGNKGLKWPYCGEIDIMEHYPGDANTVTSGIIYGTTLDTSNALDAGRSRSEQLDFNEYHIYSMEWTEEKIEFYVDDILISSTDISNKEEFFAFHKPYYIALNYAVGATGGIPDTNVNEMIMYTDWIRVYSPKSLSQSDITLNKATIDMSVGDISYLSANFANAYQVERTIKWTSDNENVATVYGGIVTGISSGIAIISATALNGVTASCVINVEYDDVIVEDSMYTPSANGLLSEQPYITLNNPSGRFTEEINGNALVLTSPSDKEQINGIFEITPEASSTGELTVMYKCIEVPTNDLGQGFRLQLSNGTKGCQLFHFKTVAGETIFGVVENNKSVKIADLELNKTYTSTLKLLGDKYEVYIDGVLVHESSILSNYYCTKNRIMNTTPGDNNGSVVTHIYSVDMNFN